MGRKGKKKGSQPARTPMRTSTILPTPDPPLQADTSPAPGPDEPLIDIEMPPPDLDIGYEPEPTPMDTSTQLSPPPSPVPDVTSTAAQHAQALPPRSPTPPRPTPTRRMDSFVRIESPPNSPPLRPSSPTRRAKSRGKQPANSTNSRHGHSSFEAYGTNPHIVACISCNDFCTLTGARGVVERHELGLDDANCDTFFPTVCSTCENYRGFLWLKVEGGRSPPAQRQQHPETLHASMLAAWPLYAAVRDRFGVAFDGNVHQHTVTVTRARDWWREGILTHDKSLVLMWHFDHEHGTMRERNPMPRKDEFFGGPQR